jgi:hypothetical protein
MQAEGQGFAVESRSNEATLKPLRTPVACTLFVLNVSAFYVSTFETYLSFPCKSR